MTSWLQIAATRLVAWRWALLAVAAVLSIAAWPASRRVEFDRSIENMFPAEAPILAPYARLKRVFGGNEVVLAVYEDAHLLDPSAEGIRRVAEVSKRLQAIPGVQGVLSLDRPLGELIVDPKSKVAAALRNIFSGYTHSRDGRVVSVACMLDDEKSAPVPRRETIDRLRAAMDSLPHGMIAGEPVMVVDGFRYVEEDGRRLGVWSTILLAATIVLLFRSLRWVLIPIAVVQMTLLLTRAALVWSGLRLSMVSSMLTAIVTVVGVATVVHVIVRFRESREKGDSAPEAIARCGVLLAAPIMWACSTDAIGFLSLKQARVGPVQDFGVMMAIGSLLVLLATPLLIPGLALWGKRDLDPRRVWGESFLDRQLRASARWVEHFPGRVVMISLAPAVLLASGAWRLDVETDFTKNFRAGSPIVKSYDFIETHLGGAGVWDIVLPAEEKITWKYLQKVNILEQRLREEVVVQDAQGDQRPGLTKVLSLADGVIAGAPLDLASVPSSTIRNGMISAGLAGMRSRMPVFMHALYSEDPAQPGRYYFRIMLRSRERQPSAAKRAVIEQVQKISREEFPQAEVTGFFVLLTHLIDSMIQDQWRTFGIATLGIFLMMFVAMRSPMLALLSLVPNALPIIVVMGLMGWLHLKINMGAAMIAAVSMGLAVDSSVHYVAAFRRARAQGLRTAEAIGVVQQSVGRAMIFSTLALIVGFSVLCTSNFVPTIYFGVLVSLSMLGGLAGNLMLLPALLRLTVRDRPAPDEPPAAS